MKIYFFKRKYILTVPLYLALIVLCVVYADACYRGIASGIGFCIDVLVPSLFALMAVSAMLTRSGTAERICAPLSGLSRRVFGLPGICLAPIILGCIGGYPVGARVTAGLYEAGSITEKQAQKTVYTAVAAGPGFLINYVGGALLHSPQTGQILLISQIISILLCGFIVGRTVPCSCEAVKTAPQKKQGNLLIDAVGDASKAVMMMCATVVLFSAVCEVIAETAGAGIVSDMLTATAEITVGCNRLCGRYPLPLIAFFIGFGGLSVHCQIFAMLRDLPIKPWLFFLYRIISGIICMLAAYIIMECFPQKEAVFSTTTQPVSAGISAAVWGSAALIIASGCFLLSISGGNYVRNSRMAQQKH